MIEDAISRSIKLEWFIRMRHGSSGKPSSPPVKLFSKDVALRSPAPRVFIRKRKKRAGLFGLTRAGAGMSFTFS